MRENDHDVHRRKPTNASSFLFKRNQLQMLSTIPDRSIHIKANLVERRTVHADVIWRLREMILTDEGIYFSRPESNMIVDKISIHDIVSVGRVDNLDKKSFETKRSSNIEPFGNILPTCFI